MDGLWRAPTPTPRMKGCSSPAVSRCDDIICLQICVLIGRDPDLFTDDIICLQMASSVFVSVRSDVVERHSSDSRSVWTWSRVGAASPSPRSHVSVFALAGSRCFRVDARRLATGPAHATRRRLFPLRAVSPQLTGSKLMETAGDGRQAPPPHLLIPSSAS